ncbi:hypothetical protein [Rhizosaccharibacter radicis]|uniref:Uncharacterized protein n=1 Tax=Rhizosaccharibacter radicis TaxID=2782605 RepID=A0ABT1VT89_9PROT|nr:hypothetical protein [Acetobacteraceae bacterium KSS12]
MPSGDACGSSPPENDAGTYRRDLNFLIEYLTVQTMSAPMLAGIGLLHVLGVNIGFGGGAPIGGVQVDGTGNILTDAAGQPLVETAP